MSQQTQDDYVIGLLLALVVFSAIPLTSTAALWLAVLLLVITWGPIVFGSTWANSPSSISFPSSLTNPVKGPGL